MKKFISVCVAVMMIMVNIISVKGTTLDKNQIIGYLDEVSKYEIQKVSNPNYGSIGGEWLVMALARYGTITDSQITNYKTNLLKKLKECDGVLSTRKYTEYARVVIALTAIEENPENFHGYNLLRPLAEFDKVTSQGANGILYTLIALDCGNYKIPNPKTDYTGEKTTREKLLNKILESQLDDGGWSIAGKVADTDMTAIAIQALKPYYNKESRVKTAINKGLDRLGELQEKDGGYKTGNRANCESTAQVLTALSSMNISLNDKRFIKDGKTVLDGLMKYYKNEGFSHFQDGDVNQMSTEQAMYGLTAYYRSISGMHGLYEMQDGIIIRKLNQVTVTENKTNKPQENVSTKKNSKKENITTKKKKEQSNVSKVTEKNEDVKETSAKREKSKKSKENTTNQQEETTNYTEMSENNISQSKASEQIINESKDDSKNGVWIIVGGGMLLASAGALAWRKKK